MFSNPTVEDVILSLKEFLSNSFGDRLVSIVHFGATAAEPSRPLGAVVAKIRVLIVVQDLGAAHWKQISAAFSKLKWRNAIAPMLMTPQEIASSTDVFPITFLEMKNCFRIVFGEDVIRDLQIQKTHLRLRCEQEARNLLVRMQANCLTTQSSTELMNILVRNFESLLRIIGGMLMLEMTTELPASEDQRIDLACRNFGLDRTILENVRTLIKKKQHPEPDWIRALYLSLMSEVAHLTEVVDQIPEEVVVIEQLDQGE